MNSLHENSEIPDDNWEAQLRAQLLDAQLCIPDDGFTQSVLAMLPTPKNPPKWIIVLQATPYLLVAFWVLWQWVCVGGINYQFWQQCSPEQLMLMCFGVLLVCIGILMVWFKQNFDEDWV